MKLLQQINDKYGPVGWIISLTLSAFFSLVLILAFDKGAYQLLLSSFAMPMTLDRVLEQPWSALTYWFAMPLQELFTMFAGLALVFGFGTILQNQLGNGRFWLVTGISVLSIPLFTWLLAMLLPTVEQTEKAVLGGIYPLGIVFLAMQTVMQPKIRLRLLGLEFKMLYVGLVLMALPLLGYRAIFTVMGTATVVAILTGVILGLLNARRMPSNRWTNQIRTVTAQGLPRERVRIKETHVNPQHKGKFTVLQGGSRMSKEDELNHLLDRINEVGYKGLTLEEKKRLEELSGE